MRRSLFLFTLFCSVPLVSLATDLKSSIDSLTLFLRGGEVHRSTTLTLEKGENEFLLSGLSPKIRPGSIRLKLSDPEKVDILSVTDRTNMFNKSTHSKELDALREKMDELEIRKDSLNDLLNAYQEEKTVFLSNRGVRGEQKNLAPEELSSMADLFKERILRINGKISEIERKSAALDERIQKQREQLNELNAKSSYRTSELEVLLKSEEPMEMELRVHYLVRGTGWAPFYEIRGESVSDPLELNYKAKIFNDTDVDWENVQVKLSTGNPERRVTHPEMEKWTLDHYRRGGKQGAHSKLMQKSRAQGQEGEQNKAEEVQYQEISVGELSAEFRIEENYSIPSNAKPYTVEIANHELPATFEHYAVPKSEESAFLLARVTDWENLDLIEGKANVYFQGGYKGRTYLEPVGIGDTLSISMGRDRNVVVDRRVKEEYTESQLIGNKKKDNLSYEIQVKNRHNEAIRITVLDQYPIPKVDDIDVSLNEKSGAEEDEETGRLEWSAEIEPEQIWTTTLSYTIKYPKHRRVSKQKYRSISAPSF